MSNFLLEGTLKKYEHNFQTYAKNKGKHPMEFVGEIYLEVLNSIDSKYITSEDLMKKLHHSIEEESKTKIFCGTEVYDYVTALNILGGKTDVNLNSDFDMILDELREDEPYFNKIKSLAEKITTKQKSLIIDMDFDSMKKCDDDAFIYP